MGGRYALPQRAFAFPSQNKNAQAKVRALSTHNSQLKTHRSNSPYPGGTVPNKPPLDIPPAIKFRCMPGREGNILLFGMPAFLPTRSSSEIIGRLIFRTLSSSLSSCPCRCLFLSLPLPVFFNPPRPNGCPILRVFCEGWEVNFLPTQPLHLPHKTKCPDQSPGTFN